MYQALSAHALTILNTGQVLLHTCQVITPDNNIATVFKYELFNADNLLNTSDMLQHKWGATEI